MGADYQHQPAWDFSDLAPRRFASDACRGRSLVITSSINGTRTFSSAWPTACACTKAAQIAMMQMVATEAAKFPAEYPAGKMPLPGDTPGRPRTWRNSCSPLSRITPDVSLVRRSGSTMGSH